MRAASCFAIVGLLLTALAYADTCYICEDSTTHEQSKSASPTCPKGMHLIGATAPGNCPSPVSPLVGSGRSCNPRVLNPQIAEGCEKLQDMKCLGWRDGDKGNFCRSKGFDGNTNPTSAGYADYKDGGLCFKGAARGCKIASGEEIVLDPKVTSCKELKDMKSLGWDGGNKGDFCRSKGYDGNWNPTYKGYVKYADGGFCYKGPTQACYQAAGCTPGTC